MYYCLTCDGPTIEEKCRDCGNVGDYICPTCGEVLDNCDCEETEEL